MKYFIFSFVICALFVFSTPAQETVAEKALFRIWDEKGKEGFVDAEGKVVIKPQFDAVMPFSEGLAAVLINGKWGYINTKGEIVIQPRWQQREKGWKQIANPFREGLAVVIEDVHWSVLHESNYYSYKCGYIDKTGKYVIEPKYRQSCEPFSSGLALVQMDYNDLEYPKDGASFGFLDKNGNWAIKPSFFNAGYFREGFSLVQTEPLPKDLHIKMDNSSLVINNPNRISLYLIDKTGRKVERIKDCRWRYLFSEGLGLAFSEGKKRYDGFVNEQCEYVFRLAEDIKTESYFAEGLVVASREINGRELFGYLNRRGETVIDFQFAKAAPFSEGLAGAALEANGKTYKAYINQKGESVVDNTRDNSPFKDGLAFHLLHTWTIAEGSGRRNIYGYMNKQGKYVWLSPRAEIYLGAEWIREKFVEETFK